MKQRTRVLILSACALGGLPLVAADAQQSGAAATKRTPWGDPDLQGMWSYNDDVNTPFERPTELGGKVEFGDEELAEVLAERARRNVERAPTIGGETGAGPTHVYEFWNARSTRTSKVIDPPEGRVPPLTPEAKKHEAARAEAIVARPMSVAATAVQDRRTATRPPLNRWPIR